MTLSYKNTQDDSRGPMHGRYHTSARSMWYRISLAMHLAQNWSLLLPTAAFPSSASLGKTAHSSPGQPVEGPTLSILQKHLAVWGRILCLSCASSQVTAEPSLGDEGACVQKIARSVPIMISCCLCNDTIVKVAHFLPLIDTIRYPWITVGNHHLS